MVPIVLVIGSVASAVMAVVALCTFLCKPIRERVLGVKAEKDALRCLIRSHIVSIYYKHLAACEIKQYEFENLALLYKQYKVLGGNSFVDKIYNEIVEDWTIVPG